MPEAAKATVPAGATQAQPLLAVSGLEGWYGESHVLHGVAFDVREGEVVTLMGCNGAGKTNTLKANKGNLHRREGSIDFEGSELIRLQARRIASRGISACP